MALSRTRILENAISRNYLPTHREGTRMVEAVYIWKSPSTWGLVSKERTFDASSLRHCIWGEEHEAWSCLNVTVRWRIIPSQITPRKYKSSCACPMPNRVVSQRTRREGQACLSWLNEINWVTKYCQPKRSQELPFEEEARGTLLLCVFPLSPSPSASRLVPFRVGWRSQDWHLSGKPSGNVD